MTPWNKINKGICSFLYSVSITSNCHTNKYINKATISHRAVTCSNKFSMTDNHPKFNIVVYPRLSISLQLILLDDSLGLSLTASNHGLNLTNLPQSEHSFPKLSSLSYVDQVAYFKLG